jgi:hypothetical protein
MNAVSLFSWERLTLRNKREARNNFLASTSLVKAR